MWVRSSSACYRTFNLAKDRSLGFGSTARDYSPYSDSVSLRLPYTVKLATDSKSLTHYTKGTQSPLLEEPSGFFACSDLLRPAGLLTH